MPWLIAPVHNGPNGPVPAVYARVFIPKPDGPFVAKVYTEPGYRLLTFKTRKAAAAYIATQGGLKVAVGPCVPVKATGVWSPRRR